jgi:hypothetical protein
MKTRCPLYLLEFGMEFTYKRNSFTLCNITAEGMYEARDKYGLLVEFNPATAVTIK